MTDFHPERFVAGTLYYRVEHFTTSPSVLRAERAERVTPDGARAMLRIESVHPVYKVGQVCYDQSVRWLYVSPRAAWEGEQKRAQEALRTLAARLEHESVCFQRAASEALAATKEPS